MRRIGYRQVHPLICNFFPNILAKLHPFVHWELGPRPNTQLPSRIILDTPILDTIRICPNSLSGERTGNCIPIILILTKTSSIAIKIKKYYLTLSFIIQQVCLELYHVYHSRFQGYLDQLLIYVKKSISLSSCQAHLATQSNIGSIISYRVLCSRTMTPCTKTKEEVLKMRTQYKGVRKKQDLIPLGQVQVVPKLVCS